jgi:lipopolysaccharide biosynthesis glycosyltransferase
MIIFIPTDFNYLEPAFITLNSLANHSPIGTRICLLYLRTSKEDYIFEEIIAEALIKFQNIYNNKIELFSIAVNSNYFLNFDKFHLTSATLQKLTIPAIFPSEDLCLSVDAGMIFGHEVPYFIEQLKRPSEAAITAFTSEAVSTLLNNQLDIPHHKLYPAGGILAFRPEIYNKINLLDRCVETYNNLRELITYGEQDIICFTVKNNELDDFNFPITKIHIDLANLTSWTESETLVEKYLSKNYFYMKHVGVFKPWKRWVLSPSKAIYIDALNNLPEEIRILINTPQISKQHTSIDKFSPIFFEQQLILYENYLGLKVKVINDIV